MRASELPSRVALLLAFAMALGCQAIDAETCLRHSDCPASRSCVSGRCVIVTPPPSGDASLDADGDASDGSDGDAMDETDGDSDGDASDGADGVDSQVLDVSAEADAEAGADAGDEDAADGP